MSASQPNKLTLDQALKILNSYDCVQVKDTEPLIELEELRNSLLLVTSLSSSINLGICADNSQQAFAAVASYLIALGYQHARGISSGNPSISEHQSNLEKDNLDQSSEPVYLKFNTQKMSYYLNKYTQEYRGVLVSCQSEDDLVAGVYGHFPWDLFMNNHS